MLFKYFFFLKSFIFSSHFKKNEIVDSVPVEDSALREMAEYMEANKDEILDKLPDNRNVTLLVFREGDQLNFFRVVDRGDGTLTPLSESMR